MKNTILQSSKFVEGFCPTFQGFYNTLFEPDFDFHLESESEHFETEIIYDYLIFDNDAYQNAVGKAYTSIIETKLFEGGYIDKILFGATTSPKEYNFANDDIYCNIILTPLNHMKIKETLESNWEAFEAYITKRYTTCSGFSSYYSNKAINWLNMLSSWNFDNAGHQISSILEFICTEVLEIDVLDDIYHTIYESMYLTEYCEFDFINMPVEAVEAIAIEWES